MTSKSTALKSSTSEASQSHVVTQSSQPSDSFRTPSPRPPRQSWQPHEYQKRAIRLLLSQGSAGLFLDPGLGKTSVVLAALKILKDQGMMRKALVIAPLTVATVAWPGELNKWEEFKDLSFSVLHGKQKEKNLQL